MGERFMREVEGGVEGGGNRDQAAGDPDRFHKVWTGPKEVEGRVKWDGAAGARAAVGGGGVKIVKIFGRIQADRKKI